MKAVTGPVLKLLAYLLITIAAVSMVYPFFWMVIASLKTEAEVFSPALLPIPPHWENYTHVFTNVKFGLFTFNSIKVGGLYALGSVLSAAWIGYGFARVRFWGRDALFIVMLSAMMIPSQVTMIPLFLIMNKIGWVDTHYPLWVPAWFGAPLGIFIMRQFFLSIPQDLLDAAKIDGCNHFGIFLRIVMPLAKPALASVALLTFMASWNSLLLPVIYLYKESLFTLPLGLAKFRGLFVSYWAYIFAGATISVVPILLVFLLTQQYFVRGVVLSGLKG